MAWTIAEKRIVDVCQMMGPEETWYAAYEERIGQMCVKLAEGFSTSTINMLLAHLYVSGSQTSGSEREIHVAQPYAVSPQRFPTSAHLYRTGPPASASRGIGAIALPLCWLPTAIGFR